MARGSVEAPVHLDRADTRPLSVQLADQVRSAVTEGVLQRGERLPSGRSLAAQLGVSRTVVTEAFQQLYAEGWVEGRHGSGTFVAGGTGARPSGGRPEPGPSDPLPAPVTDREGARRAGLVDLRPGAPWVGSVDRAAWRRAWRHAAEQPLDDSPDPRGQPRLRALLAEHLRRVRGVRVGPENVMVTGGTGHGLDLVGAGLVGAGARAGVEEPGYRKAPAVFAARGAVPVPCRVDGEGLVVEELPEDLAALYTTPAHQYPLGGRLPVPRREQLLDWARERGTTVVEDDYDGEFRYDAAPLPALYGMDPERVVLLGTLSKTLSPDLGIGWLVADPGTVGRLARLRAELSDRTPGQPQAATALLLERGDLDRHLRRMRLEYARRRRLLKRRLGRWLTGDTAGLHVLLPLPTEAVRPVVEGAAERGVLVVDTTHASFGAPPVHGLVLGYGSAGTQALERGCGVLEGLLGEMGLNVP
ncbi:MocR-like pyridoxine biosynthesis transcription factor PdxR [Nocardiopsis salina]|uniref:MocR-like pyridoxine biosynthesis transcription factor PdxR n=1 Tax=Nocardiopsis salina TaxID=245836 RepID=UPI0005935D8E|nr:PLP-dependent aminotransferase family protein [Nocardiopsis salina]